MCWQGRGGGSSLRRFVPTEGCSTDVVIIIVIIIRKEKEEGRRKKNRKEEGGKRKMKRKAEEEEGKRRKKKKKEEEERRRKKKKKKKIHLYQYGPQARKTYIILRLPQKPENFYERPLRLWILLIEWFGW